MSRYNHKHKLSPKAILYRILFSLIAIAILVIFMPRGTTSAFHYQKGEPWEEDAFIAQDSFPILKSAEQIAQEQDSLRQFYEPYFLQDVDILEQQLAALHNDFNQKAAGTPHYFLPHLGEKLRHIYSIGIIKGEEMTRFEGNTPQKIRVYSGNESSAKPFATSATASSTRALSPIALWGKLLKTPVMPPPTSSNASS